MENDGDGGEAPREHDDFDSSEPIDEGAVLLKTGPTAGNRAGGFAFLALMVLLGGILHYHFSAASPDSFPNRLDAELLAYAEQTLAANADGSPMAIVPPWPQSLFAVLRRDIAVYLAFLALAAFLWGLSARARARRDSFLVYEKLNAEIGELRRRLDGEGGDAPRQDDKETKGS